MKEHCFSALFLLLCFIIATKGSEINFSSSGTITPLLTHNLTLACSLNETTSPTSSGAIVGRRRRDVSQTSENVHPMSMLIVRGNGENVASLTQFSPAKSLLNDNNIYVSGGLAGNPVSHGYLEVRWEYPTKAAVGDYTCKVTTVSDEGLGITFSKNTSVDVSSPSIDDLVHHIHKIEVENSQQKAQLTHHQVQLSNLKTEYQELTTKLQMSQKDIERLNQTDMGLIECGDSRHWSDGVSAISGTGGRVIEKTQTFNKTYYKPPIVFLSILEPDYYSFQYKATYNPVHYGISLKHVNNNNFVVQCYASDNGGSFVSRMKASWISFYS